MRRSGKHKSVLYGISTYDMRSHGVLNRAHNADFRSGIVTSS